VTDLSVCQMELPCNNGRESRHSPQSSSFGLTPHYPPAHPRRAAGGAWQREKTPRPCSVCGAIVSAAVAIAAWLGRGLAAGVWKLLGGLDVGPCDIVCRSLCELTHSPSTEREGGSHKTPQDF